MLNSDLDLAIPKFVLLIMFFNDIPGHEALKSKLIKQVQDGKIPHARLFLGPEGSGSLALALAQAQYIQCLNRKEVDSCGKCISCQKNLKFIHPDLHFSFPFTGSGKDDNCDLHIASWRKAVHANPFLGVEEWSRALQTENKQLNINIKECHEIHRKLSMKPFEAEFQILILWRPEFMGKEGNSLLKIIEEPSSSTLMIFVAENREDILPTLISRMQLVKVNGYSDQEISSWMEEKENLDPIQASRFSFMAEGNLGQAISLSRGEVPDYYPLFTNWMEVCFEGDFRQINSWVEEIARGGKDGPGREFRKHFLLFSLRMIRESLLEVENAKDLMRLKEPTKASTPSASAPSADAPSASAPSWSMFLTLKFGSEIISLLDKSVYYVERNANPKILFLDVSLSLHKLLNTNTPAWK